MLPSTSLTEEGTKRVIPPPESLVAGHLAIGLDPVLQTVQLPTGIAHLDTGLANMDADTFTLKRIRICTRMKPLTNAHVQSL